MSYRVISSRQTELSWIIGPLFFIVATALLIGTLHFGWFATYYRRVFPEGLSPVAANPFWGAWLLFCVLSLWWNYGLKRIAVDGESIYISDVLQRAKLPLGDILGVSENRWFKTHPVTIEFAGATPWGHYVRFIPKARFLVPGWVSHPIVGELRDMASWAKRSQRVSDKLQQDSLALPPEAEP